MQPDRYGPTAHRQDIQRRRTRRCRHRRRCGPRRNAQCNLLRHRHRQRSIDRASQRPCLCFQSVSRGILRRHSRFIPAVRIASRQCRPESRVDTRIGRGLRAGQSIRRRRSRDQRRKVQRPSQQPGVGRREHCRSEIRHNILNQIRPGHASRNNSQLHPCDMRIDE